MKLTLLSDDFYVPEAVWYGFSLSRFSWVDNL